MRLASGLAAALLAVALTACSGIPVARHAVAPESVSFAPDGKSATVVILGYPNPEDGRGCAGVYGADATFDKGTMNVAAWGAEWETKQGHRCNLDELICCEHRFVIELPQGFEPDAVTTMLGVFLYRPKAGLVDLAGLPESSLVSQGSDRSDTGTWYRNYLLSGKKQTVELRQVFDGSMVREHPAYVGPIQVGEAFGELFRWPEDNEIRVTWPVGDDTLALTGSASDFTADDLVGLAESASLSSP